MLFRSVEHAVGCERCTAILEEHRQLEKDLFRLADPLPPSDFVHKVMAKVAGAPVAVRNEVRIGLGILAGSLALCVLTFVLGGGNLGFFGLKLASVLIEVRELAGAYGTGLAALWKTAAVPLTAAALLALFASLVGLQRLAGGLDDAKVSP